MIMKNGFEFAKSFDSMEEKILVLVMDATRAAYRKAGMNFDALSNEEKQEILLNNLKKIVK